MSVPLTSPDAGPRPRTPPRSPTVPTAEVSPAKVYDKYHLPENREQYQKFGHHNRFKLRAFETKEDFFEYLDLEEQSLPSEPQAVKKKKKKKKKIDQMQDFYNVASAVAKSIKDSREHYLFLCLAFLADI